MEIQKNLHIQLFDNEGRITSERLIKQDPEFNIGPKEVHEGPMRINLTLLEQNDVERAIVYLQKLTGHLPLSSPAKARGRQPGSSNQIDPGNRHEDVLAEALEAGKNQDVLISHLRELDYIFVTGDFLKMIIPEAYEIKESYISEFQWLIKRTKEAKDPKNDKFDPTLLFGIKIMDTRHERVLIYMHGELKEKIKIPLPETKALTMKGTNLIKYPNYMTEDERFKFGNEHRLLFNQPERKPSKFYIRWHKDVTIGNELKFNLKERIQNEA